MDDAMAISVRHWAADDLLMDEGRNYVERGCGIIWIYTAWATVVCDLGACSGSHDMVVCILFGRLCWFWLAECTSGLVMHTTRVSMSMVGFATEFGSTMSLWWDFCKYHEFLHGMAEDWVFCHFVKGLTFRIHFGRRFFRRIAAGWRIQFLAFHHKMMACFLWLQVVSRQQQEQNVRSDTPTDTWPWFCGWKRACDGSLWVSCDPKDLLTWTFGT